MDVCLVIKQRLEDLGLHSKRRLEVSRAMLVADGHRVVLHSCAGTLCGFIVRALRDLIQGAERAVGK